MSLQEKSSSDSEQEHSPLRESSHPQQMLENEDFSKEDFDNEEGDVEPPTKRASFSKPLTPTKKTSPSQIVTPTKRKSPSKKAKPGLSSSSAKLVTQNRSSAFVELPEGKLAMKDEMSHKGSAKQGRTRNLSTSTSQSESTSLSSDPRSMSFAEDAAARTGDASKTADEKKEEGDVYEPPTKKNSPSKTVAGFKISKSPSLDSDSSSKPVSQNRSSAFSELPEGKLAMKDEMSHQGSLEQGRTRNLSTSISPSESISQSSDPRSMSFAKDAAAIAAAKFIAENANPLLRKMLSTSTSPSESTSQSSDPRSMSFAEDAAVKTSKRDSNLILKKLLSTSTPPSESTSQSSDSRSMSFSEDAAVKNADAAKTDAVKTADDTTTETGDAAKVVDDSTTETGDAAKVADDTTTETK